MGGNKALKRACETKDVLRVGANIPLITDETIFVTPELAKEWLRKNKKNRPVNWRKVEIYSKIMERGEWQLHSQGIIFDEDGNLLTGQNRLWAIIYSECSVYMRVSKGNKASVANLLDRGSPQSARDLATRQTGKKHSPLEAMLARGILALRGSVRPTIDELAEEIFKNSTLAIAIIERTARMRKTKAMLMILSAFCAAQNNNPSVPVIERKMIKLTQYAQDLEKSLNPIPPDKCWGRGTAFSMAMENAKKIIEQ